MTDLSLRMQIITIASFLFYVWNALGLKAVKPIEPILTKLFTAHLGGCELHTVQTNTDTYNQRSRQRN